MRSNGKRNGEVVGVMVLKEGVSERWVMAGGMLNQRELARRQLGRRGLGRCRVSRREMGSRNE